MLPYLAIFAVLVHSLSGCIPKDFGHGSTVCVCNATYCDKLGAIEPNEATISIYTSNKDGLRFNRDEIHFANEKMYKNQISINRKVKYQSIMGWGGAFTDAACINIQSLPKAAEQFLLNAYFTSDGLQYNFGRVPIGGTDFSLHAYSYDDGAEDIHLERFQLADADHTLKIPIIKAALNLTGNDLKLFGSAWTAPKWMKTSGRYESGGIKPEMYQTWADYHLKFLEAYDRQGIQFWGITTGNEPSLAIVPFNRINSVAWLPKNMLKWIKENFGPTLRNSTYKDIQIMCLDDQRLFLPWWPKLVLQEGAEAFIDGIAVHWYWDWLLPAKLVQETHDAFPNKFILATESCKGDKILEPALILGDWGRAEDYAHSIIEDLGAWVTGWIDWNLALDMNGGPTYINNNVDAPIIVNQAAGEFYKQPIYYSLGHFSKFLPEHSIRIHLQGESKLEMIAFQRPDNATAIILLNKHKDHQSVSIYDENRGYINVLATPKSLSTILYK